MTNKTAYCTIHGAWPGRDHCPKCKGADILGVQDVQDVPDSPKSLAEEYKERREANCQPENPDCPR